MFDELPFYFSNNIFLEETHDIKDTSNKRCSLLLLYAINKCEWIFISILDKYFLLLAYIYDHTLFTNKNNKGHIPISTNYQKKQDNCHYGQGDN